MLRRLVAEGVFRDDEGGGVKHHEADVWNAILREDPSGAQLRLPQLTKRATLGPPHRAAR
jgi:hypothetical protein